MRTPRPHCSPYQHYHRPHMSRWHDLTEREKRIVFLFTVQDYGIKELPDKIYVSKSRVKQLCAHIYGVLGVSSKFQLAVWVGRNWELVNEVGKPKIVKAG